MLLSANDHRIYFDLVGPDSGPVVCFAHALLADGGMWADQVPALVNAGFRVLRIDMRGHGGSSVPPGVCHVGDLSSDVIAVLDHLALDKIHYVGLSIGGVVGQSIAINHPQRLLSLILSDTNAASAPNAKEMWSARIATVKEANSPAPMAAGMMGRLVTEAFKAEQPVRWQQIFEAIVATQPEGVYACANALQNFDFTADLPSLKVPTLVLCGQNDPATPPSEAMKIVNLIPGATYQEIPGALHYPNVEKPEMYTGLLLDWLKQYQ